MKQPAEQELVSTMELFAHSQKTVIPSLPQAPYVKYSETSRAAADSQTDSNRLLDMARIYRYIESRMERGSTCDEAEIALKMSHQTCSARFSEMSDPEKATTFKLIQSGAKRKTRTGRPANVYVTRV